MQCAELDKLRGQAREIHKEMAGRRERAHSLATRKPMAGRKDELQDLLSRKLARTIASIERHVAQHKCQE